MKKIILSLILVFFGFFISCSICEIFVRFFKLAPDISPIVLNKPWGDFETVNYKNIRYLPKLGSKDINNFGLKDRDFSLEKPDKTYRILVLGDSIVYGLCYAGHLKIGSRVSEKLENLLNKNSSDIKYQVYNFGVSGFDAQQEVDLLELRGLQFKPDLVVQVYCLNDDVEMSAEIDDLNKGQSKTIRAIQESRFGQYLLWSHFYRFVYQRLSHLLKADPKVDQVRMEKEGTIVENAYNRLANYAKEYNFKVLIATQPFIIDLTNYSEEWEHERTMKMAKQHDFAYVDLLPIYKQKLSSIEEVSCGDILHPNEYGHQLLAESLADQILGLSKN